MRRKNNTITVLTNERLEKFREVRRKEKRSKRIKQAIIVLIILLILVVLNIIQQSRCDYFYYKEEIETDENSGVFYENFKNGYIKYSNNGIEYQQTFGVAQWNIALVFSKPFLEKSDNYVLFGDRGGNKVLLFDESGLVHEYTMKYPVVQFSVANNGSIEAILQGEDCNYIQVYTSDGTIIAETKVTIDETGYPVTACISPDGSQLAVSYYIVENLVGKTRMTFYDFSKQIHLDEIPWKADFDYEDTLIPEIRFVSDTRLAAFGDHKTYMYDIADEAKQIKRLSFDESIESIFGNDKYLGYVCNTEDSQEGKYHVYLYNKKGNEKMNLTLDMNYDDIFMVGDEIFATSKNECTIINKNGNILFQGTLEGESIENVLESSGWRTYRVIFNDKIVKMKLSFISHESSEKKTEE